MAMLAHLSSFSSFLLVLVVFGTGCSAGPPVANQQERLDLAATYSADKDGDAMLVWIDSTLVREDYQNGYSRGQRHILTEISMLFPVLTLLASSDEASDLNTPVSADLPAWSTTQEKATITWSELLHFTSGLAPMGVGSGDVPTFDEALGAPLVHAPGESFRFGPTAVQVLGAVMERSERIEQMKDRLFHPLNIAGGYWTPVTEGEEASSRRKELTPRLFDGAQLTPRELGRIGQLLLNDGRWHGEQVIENVDRLTEPTPASPGFGLGVWLNVDLSTADSLSFWPHVPERILLPRGQDHLIYDGAPADLFMAAGRYNQRLYVIPSREMVVVRLGRADRTWSDVAFLARLLEGSHR